MVFVETACDAGAGELSATVRYSDHLIVMYEGRIVAVGPPEELITAELLRDVFGLDSRILVDPVSSRPMIVPVGVRRSAPMVQH